MAHRASPEMGSEVRGGCVQAVQRALALLDQLAEQKEGLTLTEIARRVELPRSTAHRLLTTMETMRYVAFDVRTNEWLAGVRTMAFGAGDPKDVARLARPILQLLQTGARATASLATVEGPQVRYAGQARVAADRWAPARTGDLLPLHTTATGKAILAFWPVETLARYLAETALEPRTAASITDPAALRRELEVIRRRGYAVDDQETRAGVRCVAAPVLGRDGRPRAAVGVSCPLLDAPPGRLPSLGARVQFSARRLTDAFGSAVAA
jgi:IclR family acetate operon transcriptional repressor